MGLFDIFKKSGKTDEETLKLLQQLQPPNPPQLATLQRQGQNLEEKTGLQIIVMNEAKKEKMEYIREYRERMEHLRQWYYEELRRIREYGIQRGLDEFKLLDAKTELELEFHKRWIEEIDRLVKNVALLYGRGGDNPKFQKLYAKYSLVKTYVQYIPTLAPYLEYAAELLLSASQYDKDIAINTPVLIKKEYPDMPKFEAPITPTNYPPMPPDMFRRLPNISSDPFANRDGGDLGDDADR